MNADDLLSRIEPDDRDKPPRDDDRASVSLRKPHTLYELDSYVGDFCNLLKVAV